MEIRTLIVDDDLISRKMIGNLLKSHYSDFPIKYAKYAIDGIIQFNKFLPHIIILDYEMPYGNAIEFMEALFDKNFEVIIISGHSYSEISKEKEFKYYIQKPVDKSVLFNTIDKIIRNIYLKQTQNFCTDSLETLKPESIIRLEAEGSYSYVFTNYKRILISKRLSLMEKIIPSCIFFRIHRSHIINIKYIKNYKLTGEKTYVQMEDNSKVPISRSKKKEFMQKITQLNS